MLFIKHAQTSSHAFWCGVCVHAWCEAQGHNLNQWQVLRFLIPSSSQFPFPFHPFLFSSLSLPISLPSSLFPLALPSFSLLLPFPSLSSVFLFFPSSLYASPSLLPSLLPLPFFPPPSFPLPFSPLHFFPHPSLIPSSQLDFLPQQLDSIPPGWGGRQLYTPLFMYEFQITFSVCLFYINVMFTLIFLIGQHSNLAV